MSEIKCTVDSCQFHDRDNVCMAKSIEVNNNDRTLSCGTDMEVGEIGACEASTSEGTCCRTYRPKGSER